MTNEKKEQKSKATPVGHSIVTYPRELPTHDIGHIIAHLRGQEVIPIPDLVQHCTTTIGCGMEYMKKGPQPVGATIELSKEDYSVMSNGELADTLESAMAPQAAADAEAEALPVWVITVLPVLYDVLRRFFKF